MVSDIASPPTRKPPQRRTPKLSKNGKRLGRPSSYSDAVAEEICNRLANGETMMSITRDPRMPDAVTVWKWERDFPVFLKNSARARENGTHRLADECIAIADDPTLDPNDKRIRIDTRIRLIGKWNAKKYGDKIDVTGEVQHKFVPLDELAAKIQAIKSRESAGALPGDVIDAEFEPAGALSGPGNAENPAGA